MKLLLFRLAALALGLLVVGIVLEVALRLSPPEWLEQRMGILDPGVDLRTFGSDRSWPFERAEGRFSNFLPDNSFRVSHYEYNHLARIGPLGERRSAACSGGSLEGFVPVLGDSYTFGIGVEDDETYVSLLGGRLGRCLLNLGVPGAGIDDLLHIVEHRHDELGAPGRYIFVIYLGNDLRPVRSPRSLDRARPHSSLIKRTMRRLNEIAYHNPLLKRLYSFQYVRAKLVALDNRIRAQRRDPLQVMPIFDVMREESAGAGGAYLKPFIERLRAMAAELGFEPFVLVVPHRYQLFEQPRVSRARYYGIDPSALDPGLPNRVVADVLEGAGIPFLDITPCLARVAQGPMHYVSSGHLTPLGHRLAAECMAPGVREFLAGSAGPSPPSTSYGGEGRSAS